MSSTSRTRKTKSATLKSSHHQLDVKDDNSSSHLFELKAKPKLTCIPRNCERLLKDLKKTQSLNIGNNSENPEKTWSVLYIGSRSNVQKERLYF